MESKINYALVGLFVITLTAILIIIAFWLSAGLTEKHYYTYIAYMKESVAGLSIESPVKYNGVNVGYVSDIRLDENDPKQVNLVLQIAQNVKLSTDTTATLMVQGITGIAYIGLKGGNSHSPRLATSLEAPYPVIKTEPSFLFRLDTALQQLSLTLNQLSINVNALLNSQNQLAFKNTLANLEQITKTFADNSSSINKSLGQLPLLLNQITKSADSVNLLAKSLTNTNTQASVTLQNFSSQTIPQTTSALTNLQNLLTHLQHLTNNIEQNPAILLRGQQPLPPGPGE